MGAYSVAETKAQLSALLQAVELGEEITITRRGVAVAVLSPVKKMASPIDWERIRACRQRTRPAKNAKPRDWTALVGKMRDEA